MIGAYFYCAGHAELLLGPIRERVMLREGFEGIGRSNGVYRPDHGPGMFELDCSACGYGWVGLAGQECNACAVTRERLAKWQAEKLLRPELPDRDSPRFDGAFEAWAERLARGVDAGLVTAHDATKALRRRGVHLVGAA
jgi:hypothetical protein